MARRHHKGFTLVEAILGAIILIVVMSMAAMLYSVVFNGYNRPSHDYAGAVYGDAPNPGQYARAVLLHTRLKDALSARTHVYVYGGYGQIASQTTTAPASARGPISESWHPATITGGTFAANSAALGPSVFAPYDTAGNPTLPIAAQIETFSEAKNFSVVVMGGFDQVLAVAHVRCESDGTTNYYRVTLYDSTGLARTTDYRYSIPTSRDTFALPVGATTYWEGVGDARAKRFTTPTYRLIFPDPTLTPDASVEPVSAFVYYENAVR